jgi:hypothetical protein
MRKFALLWGPLAAAVAVVLAVPADSEAGLFRRNRGCSCPPPAVYAPGYPAPGWPAPFGPAYGTQPGVPGGDAIVSPRTGRTYVLIDTGEGEDYEKDLTPIIPGAKTDVDPFNSFRGKARRKAKVSVAHAPPEAFASVSDLIATLESDQVMASNPNITKASDSDRVEEEMRNVTVSAFLYAFKKEADNDYHVIIGDPPGTPGGKFFNVEISGLPTGADNPTAATKKKLTAARKAFKDFFHLGNTGPNNYTKPNQPVPVLISGSLFWDIEHPPPNTVGPTATKPKSAWEIHPITSIVLDAH